MKALDLEGGGLSEALSEARAGLLVPAAKEEDAAVDEHSREMIGDERRPHPGEARTEEVGEDPREWDAEPPVADRRPHERGHGVARAAEHAGEREVSAHERLRDGEHHHEGREALGDAIVARERIGERMTEEQEGDAERAHHEGGLTQGPE